MTLGEEAFLSMTDIIKDREFWLRVEFVASGWLSTAPEKERRRCWIDGFTPSALRRTNAAAEVSGTAWVMHQDAGLECDFVAIIPWRVVNRDRTSFEIVDIEIDLQRKTLEIVLRQNPKKPNKAPEPTLGLARFSQGSEVFDVIAGVAHL